MRELLRNVARANMRKAGLRRINKARYTVDWSGNPVKLPSYFAQNWRRYAQSN